MICEIHNVECSFMSKKGCRANGGSCYLIIDKCAGCDRVVEYKPTVQELEVILDKKEDIPIVVLPNGEIRAQVQTKYCSTCSDPKVSWRRGNCVFATHIVEELTKDGKVLNAMKASKRKAMGR